MKSILALLLIFALVAVFVSVATAESKDKSVPIYKKGDKPAEGNATRVKQNDDGSLDLS